MKFQDLLKLSPFPLVDLSQPETPRDGFLVRVPAECRKNFIQSRKCYEHYERIKTLPGVAVQCPFGFASMTLTGFNVAFTGLVPFPRLGGESERFRAKRYPENKIAVNGLLLAAEGLSTAEKRIREVETDVAKKQSVALHEMRKLNRVVKQTAERLCLKESPEDIDNASREVVRILKTSELMSDQFEFLELLANEELASLPLNTVSEIYRIFDKCVRIYRPEGTKDRMTIRAPASFAAKVRVCDKTFPIIPTVLIENAIKHSMADSRVTVELRPEGDDTCVASVASVTTGHVPLTSEIFDRGVRATSEVEGSGNGLYLAQLVAHQHKTVIQLQTELWGGNRQKVTFSLRLPLVRQ